MVVGYNQGRKVGVDVVSWYIEETDHALLPQSLGVYQAVGKS